MDPVRRDGDASPWLLLGVLGAALLSAALAARELPPWRAVQARYRAARPDFAPGLREASGGRGELCGSCHLAGAGYEPLPELPFSEHPEVGHDPLELGCTPCHGGDAGSAALHPAPSYGRDAPLPGELAWLACLGCHDADREPGLAAAWPPLARAQETLAEAVGEGGCLACHRLGARGGLVGPDLSSFGQGPVADPTAPYAGRREQAERKLQDPEALQPASRMPPPDLDEAQRRAVAAWLSLRGRPGNQGSGAWVPGAALGGPEETFAWFCAPCHGGEGQGRERGTAPGAVPALDSALWRATVPRELLRQTLRQGRPGSQMEGFRAEGAEPILSEPEIDALLDRLEAGELGGEPDPAIRDEVAATSCPLCHFRREDYVAGRGDAARAAFLTEHPWRWTLQDWLDDEGFAPGDCQAEVEDEEGQRRRVHAGEHLYATLCVQCHEDAERAPAGQEPSAPALRGCLERPHFDAGYLLAAAVLGRADAAPVKWRHQGIRQEEYTPRQLACLARWLEEHP